MLREGGRDGRALSPDLITRHAGQGQELPSPEPCFMG